MAGRSKTRLIMAVVGFSTVMAMQMCMLVALVPVRALAMIAAGIVLA